MGRLHHEGPQHAVVLTRGYWLGETLVTQALWTAVMGKNPSRFKSVDRPVESVSWEACQEFIAKVNGRVPGLEVRLLTEAEWEYACRAGTTTATWAGDLELLGASNAPRLDGIAWYGGNSGKDFDLPQGEDSSLWSEKQHPHTRAGTRPVGQKAANPFGLFDMLGNVWEWCADRYGPYEVAPAVDPWGPATGTSRVIRGGSWTRYAMEVRAASRNANETSKGSNSIGFRLARGPSAPR